MSAAARSQPPAGHPEGWRRTLTAAEPGAPWVTFYQPASGARVELSRATFDNWVAKAASMLSDECDVERGTEVLFDLQPHWLLPVWAWATWALGATVVLPDRSGTTAPDAEVCITDDPAVHHSAATVILSSRHPLGLPATQAAPGPGASGPGESGRWQDSQAHPGVVDALADIRGYPDIWTEPVPAVGEVLVRDAAVSLSADDVLMQLLQAQPVLRAALLRTRPLDAATFTRALLGPAFHGSSLVIVDGGSPADIDAITTQERVDVDLG